jgi:hypothetical protein
MPASKGIVQDRKQALDSILTVLMMYSIIEAQAAKDSRTLIDWEQILYDEARSRRRDPHDMRTEMPSQRPHFAQPHHFHPLG